MEIPDAMLETQQRQMVEDFAQRLSMQGLTLEQYYQFTGLDHDKMLEQVKPTALKRIQSRLVLEAVAEAEDMTTDDADYDKEVTRLAEIYQMEEDKVREMLGEREKKELMRDVVVKKAVDFVVEKAKEK